MQYSYKVVNGKLLLTEKRPVYYRRIICEKAAEVIAYFFIIAISFFLILFAFDNLITALTIENAISVGAVFSTIGSSIVSISSILCNKQDVLFENNINVLQKDLINFYWKRWTFLNRVTKSNLGKGKYQVIENPYIEFEFSTKKLKVNIPSSKSDYDELPVVITFLKLLFYKKSYRNSLIKLNNEDALQEILVWNCISSVYKNILTYKIGKLFVWFGCCLVFFSILFSLFYPKIFTVYEVIFKVLSSQK
ncbi:MAG: hypothetical protein MJ168_10770 [Clostridia bacterium]|nr:hypothetical protein [Clostridia bacterium]